MSLAAMVKAMAASGCSAEQIAATVGAFEEDRLSKKRAGNLERQRRFRERNGNNALQGVTERDTPPPNDTASTLSSKVESNLTPTPYNPPTPKIEPDFEAKQAFESEWWPAYPHKVGKPDAMRKYIAAHRKAGTDALLAGLQTYIRTKPPDRPWCNPATWLNQERWNDKPAPTSQSLFPGTNGRRGDENSFIAAARRDIAAMRDDPGDGIPGWHEGDGEPSLDLAASGGSYRTLLF